MLGVGVTVPAPGPCVHSGNGIQDGDLTKVSHQHGSLRVGSHAGKVAVIGRRSAV